MTKKTRLTILLIFTGIFFVAGAYIVLYSLGYRIDFEEKRLVATGGIYVRTHPLGADITIGSEKTRTSFFNSSVFVQNLLPKNHSVSIKETGFFDYQKTLDVKENYVTKLENVILFKKEILFSALSKKADYFSISPDGRTLLAAEMSKTQADFQIINLQYNESRSLSLALANQKILSLKWSNDSSKALLQTENRYFLIEPLLATPTITPLTYLDKNTGDILFNPHDSGEIFFIKNKNLYSSKQALPVLKSLISFDFLDNSIIWLAQNWLIYKSDLSGKNIEQLTSAPLLKPTAPIKIIPGLNNAFLLVSNKLLVLNSEKKSFADFYSPVVDAKLSPDGQKLLYYNDREISYYFPNSLEEKKETLLITSPEKIAKCFWLNSDYLIFSAGDKIKISEIDNRGNVNIITLPQKTKNPEMFFNQQDQKAYILTEGNILASEKLLP